MKPKPWIDALAPFAAFAILVGYALFVSGSALALSFVNDDYLILDKTLWSGFVEIWRPADLLFGWYRPWSREFHYWSLAHVFGTDARAFHAANLGLWLLVLALYFGFVRRVVGAAAAAAATCAVASLDLWSSPLFWVAGVQELWLLCFALLFLHAVAGGRPAIAILWLVLALLSKETAAVLPAIALVYVVLVDRVRLLDALRRTSAFAAVVLAWAVAHPTLRERLFGSLRTSAETLQRPSLDQILTRTLGAQFNLDLPVAPEFGWEPVVLRGLMAGSILGASYLLLRGQKAGAAPAEGAPAPGRGIQFGLVWAGLGWAILLLPSIGWHAYYGVLGSLGLWMAVGVALSRRTRVVLPMLLVLSLLREAEAVSPSWDWGTAWYHQRAGRLLDAIHNRLMAFHPAVPPHSRMFFARIPNNIGLISSDGPALRIWYEDPTLEAGFYSSYERRPSTDETGPDYFFRFDSVSVLVEVIPGSAESSEQRARPGWRRDHAVLASMFLYAGNTLGAAEEYEKLWQAAPEQASFALYAATAFEAAGDSLRAKPLYEVARRALGASLVREESAVLVRSARANALRQSRAP